VIGDAMRQLGALRAAGAALPVCVVKLGAPTLADAGLVRYIDDQFRRQRVPYANVCFEVTEAAVVANLIQSRKVMHEIQSLGCSLSLDDFGAGMSSFGYLRTLPVDYVKVDGALVRNLDTDPVDAATVESINKVGHALGKRTIADMVERPEMREMLRRIGFDYMQGYAAGPILPLEEVLAERRAALAVEESGSI
jgi:EAL domain-containing protein (putative c-di-GMP-specific phosphodiesterase class I)